MVALGGTSQGVNEQTLEEAVRARYRAARLANPSASIEAFLAEFPDARRSVVLKALIAEDLEFRRSHGEQPSPTEYQARFPADETTVAHCFGASLPDTDHDEPAAPEGDGVPTLPFTPLRQFERYQLVHQLGAGGFGEVWRARDPLLDRYVAVKMLRSDKRTAPGLAGLLQEGRRLSQLDHESIVRVLDAGICDGQVFLVSELMEGGSLERRLREGPVAVGEAVQWIRDLALALHHAHVHGFIHRDVKPANILFDAECRAHLADFGVAASETELCVEQPGAIGTLAYMSPEQARGESHLVDARSDVFSLGVVFYRLLTGRFPYSAENWKDYRQQLLTRPPRALRLADDSIAPELEAICLKCLDRDAERRWTTALELAEHLEAWQRSQTAPAPPPPRQWTRRAFAASGITCLGALGLAAFVPRERKENAGALPAVQAPSGPAWSRPELIAWNPFSAKDYHGYDAAEKQYRAEAFGHALFKVGEDRPPLALSIEFDLYQRTGYGGVFWGLTRAQADDDLHCWAVVLGQFPDFNELRVGVCEYAIHPGKRFVHFDSQFYIQPLNKWPDSRISLEVATSETHVRQITVNDERLLQQPVDLPARAWAAGKVAGLGFCAQFGVLSVSRFSTL